MFVALRRPAGGRRGSTASELSDGRVGQEGATRTGRPCLDGGVCRAWPVPELGVLGESQRGQVASERPHGSTHSSRNVYLFD